MHKKYCAYQYKDHLKLPSPDDLVIKFFFKEYNDDNLTSVSFSETSGEFLAVLVSDSVGVISLSLHIHIFLAWSGLEGVEIAPLPGGMI
jgi:hypothetical protein